MFNALYDAHYLSVRAYAWRRDAQRADDIAAETFLVAWRRLEDVPCTDALPWLLSVARNTHLNLNRGARRRTLREERVARLDGAAVVHDEHVGDDDRALYVLGYLSEADQEVLRLVAWEGLDHAGIAHVLGCSRAAVAVRLHRARRRFQKLWSNGDADGAAGHEDAAKAVGRCRVNEGGLQHD